MYVLSFDLSLSDSGICIYDNSGNAVRVVSCKTMGGYAHQERLKAIADFMLNIRNVYETKTIALEAGFSRFAASTQAIYKVVGLTQYLFSDCEQNFYPPSTVKKVVTGSGKATKEDVRSVVSKIYPKLEIANDDESDAVAVGLCYFIDKKIIKLEKNNNG